MRVALPTAAATTKKQGLRKAYDVLCCVYVCVYEHDCFLSTSLERPFASRKSFFVFPVFSILPDGACFIAKSLHIYIGGFLKAPQPSRVPDCKGSKYS